MATCECGRAKSRGAECCAECRFLDGGGIGEAGLIATLRLLGGRGTSYEIADARGCSQRTVLRMIRRLRDQGRVQRFEPDGTRPGSRDGAAVFVLCDRRGKREVQPCAIR